MALRWRTGLNNLGSILASRASVRASCRSSFRLLLVINCTFCACATSHLINAYRASCSSRTCTIFVSWGGSHFTSRLRMPDTASASEQATARLKQRSGPRLDLWFSLLDPVRRCALRLLREGQRRRSRGGSWFLCCVECFPFAVAPATPAKFDAWSIYMLSQSETQTEDLVGLSGPREADVIWFPEL